MSWLNLRLTNAFSALLFAVFAIAAASSYASNPGELSETDCERFLTEEQILTKHIANSSQDLQRFIEHHEEQIKAVTLLLNGKAPEGHKIHILLQTLIKRLNEKRWHMTGTEEYLETFHDLLHNFLKTNPQFGVVLPNEYKNHFVLSPLSKADFQTLVIEPLSRRIVKAMSARNPKIDWAEWIEMSLFHAVGDSPAEAFFRTGLLRAAQDKVAEEVDINEWRNTAQNRRAFLVASAANHDVKWETVLALLHHYVGRGKVKEAVLQRWLKEKGLSEIFFREALKYHDNLQTADFHPMPDSAKPNWIVERRMLFAAAKESSHVVVTDIRDLGSIGRRFQDAWIEKGAHLEELPNVYAQSTEALEHLFAQTFLRLKNLIGETKDIHVYRSGDDGIWMLPEMTPDQLAQVKAIFRVLGETGQQHLALSLKLHYSDVVKINKSKDPNEGVAEALMKARHDLMTAKQLFKRRTPKKL